MEFQSGSPSTYYRISNVVHGGGGGGGEYFLEEPIAFRYIGVNQYYFARNRSDDKRNIL